MQVYESLVDLSIIAARRDLCTGNLAIILLTDLFEYHTTSECEKLFDLVAKRIDVWKEELFFKSVKNQLLRTCNDLLRRLSRSQNTVFCGRILVFLAKFFPFFERSGLNLISEFNNDEAMQVKFDVERVEFKAPANVGNGLDSNRSSQIEEEEGLILTNESIVLDFDLYKKFWSLQEFFRTPTLCYKPLHWKKFTDCADETIELFTNFKADSSCNLHALDSLDRNYFPKYLTSQKLLELQLCDSNFKRNVLIQFAILFQYLTGKVKFKSEQQVLNEDQLKWVKETSDRVLDLIAKTSPNGEDVREAVSNILSREEFWSNWKNEACTELKKCNEQPKKKLKTSSGSAKVNLGERIRQSELNNELVIGSEQLTKIWNLNQDNWNACKTANRVFVPTVDDYFESVLTKEVLEYKHFYTDEPIYCWRALRLLAKQSTNFFVPSNTSVKPVKEYIESTIDKLASDKQSANENNAQNKDHHKNPKSNSSSNSTNSNPNSNSTSEELVYNLEQTNV